nr:ribonuclease H-like domain-containing protein [Tanacetum cinerariifolium]
MVTRSQSGIVKPLEHFSLHAASISPIPKNPFVALQNSHWRQAMLDEYNALIKNGTWILVPKPACVNMVHSMWLFKHKFHANGTLSRYKARLVEIGSSQQQGIDVDETFSPPREDYFGCDFFLWKEERVRLLVSSPGALLTPSYPPGHSTPPSYSP